MCKEHIKALQQVIKLTNKNGLPILKCMCHSNGTLKATNLTVMVEVETPTIKDGIWNATALDYGFRDDTENKDFTVEDYPEVEMGKLIQEVELDETDMAKILRASEFTSKDMTRPALTGVEIKDGKVYGADGYKLYRDRLSQDISETINLPQDCIKVLKAVKADKHGVWVMSIYEDEKVVFTHGKFRLYTQTIYEKLPNCDQILEMSRGYRYMVRIDMKQIKPKKDQVLWGDTEEQKLYIANEDGSDKILISECLTICEDELPDTDHREVIMPMTNKEHIVMSLQLFKQYKGKVDIYVGEVGVAPVNVAEL